MATQIIASYEDWKTEVDAAIVALGHPAWIDYPEELSRMSHRLGHGSKDWATTIVDNRVRSEDHADDHKEQHLR